MKRVCFLMLTLLLMSCGSTSVVQSWKDPNTNLKQENFQKILVVALVNDESNRRIIEDKIAATNKKVHVSYPFMKELDKSNNQEEKLNFLKSNGFDAVITMGLIKEEKEKKYVPGSYSGGYNTVYYGGRFGGWYSIYSPGFYTPGYYTEDTKYLIETNVFSLNSDTLIWSCVTSSYNISSISRSTDEILKAITKQMKRDGFLVEN